MSEQHEYHLGEVTPLPVPARAGGVLLFGGVFDPPHRAHIQIPMAVRDSLFGNGGWLVYVPAARSPHKPEGATASDADRVEMLRLATLGMARVGVWTDEIDRDGGEGGGVRPSYWVDTLERAKLFLGNVPVRFLMGADQAAAFDRWREPRRILELAEPTVILREPFGRVELLAGALHKTGSWSEQEIERWCSWVMDAPLMVETSTEVREAIERGNREVVAKYLPREVGEYVRERGLYGG